MEKHEKVNNNKEFAYSWFYNLDVSHIEKDNIKWTKMSSHDFTWAWTYNLLVSII